MLGDCFDPSKGATQTHAPPTAGNPSYLGDAQKYWLQHLSQEARTGLAATKKYYTYSWDNSFWGASVLLANITGQQQYHDVARLFLRTWIDVKAPSWGSIGWPTIDDFVTKSRMNRRGQVLSLVERDGKKYQLKDVCIPQENKTAQAAATAGAGAGAAPAPGALSGGRNSTVYKQYEDVCNDGVDNDCDGLVDDDDPDCPFIPVKYTDKQLAWTERAPLPNAAAASFLALMYSSQKSVAKPLQDMLRCWALGQVRVAAGNCPTAAAALPAASRHLERKAAAAAAAVVQQEGLGPALADSHTRTPAADPLHAGRGRAQLRGGLRLRVPQEGAAQGVVLPRPGPLQLAERILPGAAEPQVRRGRASPALAAALRLCSDCNVQHATRQLPFRSCKAGSACIVPLLRALRPLHQRGQAKLDNHACPGWSPSLARWSTAPTTRTFS
jgi:hypothetical protein